MAVLIRQSVAMQVSVVTLKIIINFIILNLDNSSEDAGDVMPSYHEAWTYGLLVNSSVQLPDVGTSTDYRNNNQSGNDLSAAAKKQSDDNGKKASENTSSKELDESTYKSLPSKTFNASAEAESYKAILEEDAKKAAAATSNVQGGDRQHLRLIISFIIQVEILQNQRIF